MKSKQIGLTEYNDAILSIYGANPVATLKKAKGATTTAPDLKKDPQKKKQPKTGTLLKETLRLRNTAVLNLKLAKKIQKYEKQRLTGLKTLLDKDETSEQKGNASEEERNSKKKLKPKTKIPFSARLLRAIKQLLKKGFKKLWKKLIPKGIRKRLRLLRKRISRFRRAVRVNLKRQWRKFTKPFRQLRRKFIDPIKRRFQRFQRANQIRGQRFRRNLTKPFRQATRFVEGVVRDPRKALDSARKIGSEKLQQGRRFVSEGLDNLRSRGTKLFNQGTGAASKFKDRIFGGFRALGDRLSPLAKKSKEVVTKVINVAKDPETYKKIANQFQEKIGKPIAELGGKAKGILTEALEKLWNHPKVQKLAKSQISAKVLKKLGTKGGGKLLLKLIPGLNIGIAVWDMVNYVIKGDMEGAIIALGEAIPFAGWGFVALNLTRELFPEWYAQNIRKNLTGVESKEELNKGLTEGAAELGAYSEGGIVPAQPQLVIVGEGGEQEYIIPESKLAYFLGSDAAIDFLNFGGSQVVSTVSEYLKKLGIGGEAKSKIGEFKDADKLPKEGSTNNVKGIKPFGSSIKDISDKIIKFIVESFEKLVEPLKKIVGWIKKNVLDNPLVKGARGLVGAIGSHIFGGNRANAATLPPSLNMNSSGVVGGATNGKFGQISSGYGDTDGQDTGVDIELYGSEGKIGRKYGYQSEQGPYGGRGVEIAFPYELTYNEFVPGGRNKGARSVTSQGSTNREVKGQGQGGFGYIGSYTFTDENGRRYEIMMGHGDRPFNQFKEGEKLPPGTVLGYQGATGSSDDGAGGLYDHITFHVNAMDGGNADKVIRQFTEALISGRSKKATEQLRASQAQTPVTSPINKNDAVGEDPNSQAEENMFLQMMSRRLAAQNNPGQQPSVLPVPIPLPGAGNMTLFNTPAWGNASVVGN